MKMRFLTSGGIRWALALPALGLLCVGAGCAPSTKSLMKSLTFATYEFNSGVRWGKLQQAARRLSPPLRDKYLTHTEKTDDAVRVAEVDLLRSTIDPKRRSAVLRYRYVWHRPSVGLVRRTVVAQIWKQKNNTWYVTRIEHASGKKFPLFEGMTGKTPKARRRAPARTPPRRKAARAPVHR